MKSSQYIGKEVIIHPENDNECYEAYRNEVLLITHVATSVEDHPGYDSAINEPLFDLKVKRTGDTCGMSLYLYEVEFVN